MGRKDNDGSILGGVLLGIGALAGLGYAAYKTIKDKQTPPQLPQKRIISPSEYTNLLDFSEDYIATLHVAYTRVIPALAALVSLSGLEDIRGDNSDIEDYVASISGHLSEESIQTEYVDSFARQTIELVYSTITSHNRKEELESKIVSFIKENYSEDNYIIFFNKMFSIPKIMDAASYSEAYSIAKGLHLSKQDIKQSAINAGYNEEVISFPVIPVKPSQFDDLCDFDKDYIKDAYYTAWLHKTICRIIPSIAAILALEYGVGLPNVAAYIKEHSDISKANWAFGPTYSIKPFVNATIDHVFENANAIGQIKKRVSNQIERMNDENLIIGICQGVLKIVGQMDNDGWQELFNIFSGKLPLDSFKEIASSFGYDASTITLYDIKEIEVHLKTLGLKNGATKEEVVKAFKTLSFKVHPDTIADKQLDEEFIKFANKRFAEIKEAYDYLKQFYFD